VIDSPAIGSLLSVGSQVVITGGKPPYSVSITSGVGLTKINQTTWQVTSVPDCSTLGSDYPTANATVTVTDYCGLSAEGQYRLDVTGADWYCPKKEGLGGGWTTDWTDCEEDPSIVGTCVRHHYGAFCFCSSGINGYYYNLGAYRYRENCSCVNPDPGQCICDAGASGPLNGASLCPSGGCTSIYSRTLTVARWRFEWRCPT